jgi:hypothetical protein
MPRAPEVKPAMAAGITDKQWSVEDIVALVEASEPKPGKRGPSFPPSRLAACPQQALKPVKTFLQEAKSAGERVLVKNPEDRGGRRELPRHLPEGDIIGGPPKDKTTHAEQGERRDAGDLQDAHGVRPPPKKKRS